MPVSRVAARLNRMTRPASSATTRTGDRSDKSESKVRTAAPVSSGSGAPGSAERPSAQDRACAEVAGAFYSYLLDHRDANDSNRTVAEALQHSVAAIRNRFHPIDWAPFIHLGA